MKLGISGRTALVLGGSKGIGRQIVRDFASEGTNVIVVARSQGPIDDAVSEARDLGVRAIGISAVAAAVRYQGESKAEAGTGDDDNQVSAKSAA